MASFWIVILVNIIQCVHGCLSRASIPFWSFDRIAPWLHYPSSCPGDSYFAVLHIGTHVSKLTTGIMTPLIGVKHHALRLTSALIGRSKRRAREATVWAIWTGCNTRFANLGVLGMSPRNRTQIPTGHVIPDLWERVAFPEPAHIPRLVRSGIRNSTVRCPLQTGISLSDWCFAKPPVRPA